MRSEIMTERIGITICKKCGYGPCFPWSDKHDDDFAKEIEAEKLAWDRLKKEMEEN